MSNSSISEETASDSSVSPSETPLLTNDLVQSEQDFLKGVYQSDCSDTEISPEDVVELESEDIYMVDPWDPAFDEIVEVEEEETEEAEDPCKRPRLEEDDVDISLVLPQVDAKGYAILPENHPVRTYCYILGNAFNSHSISELTKFLKNHATPTCTMLYEYQGGKSPYGGDWLTIHGQPSMLALWDSLFHGIPDAVFDIIRQQYKFYSNGRVRVEVVFNYTGHKVLFYNTDFKASKIFYKGPSTKDSDVEATMKDSESDRKTNNEQKVMVNFVDEDSAADVEFSMDVNASDSMRIVNSTGHMFLVLDEYMRVKHITFKHIDRTELV